MVQASARYRLVCLLLNHLFKPGSCSNQAPVQTRGQIATLLYLVMIAPLPAHLRGMWRDSRAVITGLILAVASEALCGCSNKKAISRDEVRSEIGLAASIVAESELFVDYLRQGSFTRTYAEQHASYLEDAAKQLEQELDPAAAEPGTEAAADKCRIQLRRLRHELSAIRDAGSNRDKLAAINDQLANIRRGLQEANSSL
jgi:hypothetical protein